MEIVGGTTFNTPGWQYTTSSSYGSDLQMITDGTNVFRYHSSGSYGSWSAYMTRINSDTTETSIGSGSVAFYSSAGHTNGYLPYGNAKNYWVTRTGWMGGVTNRVGYITTTGSVGYMDWTEGTLTPGPNLSFKLGSKAYYGRNYFSNAMSYAAYSHSNMNDPFSGWGGTYNQTGPMLVNNAVIVLSADGTKVRLFDKNVGVYETSDLVTWTLTVDQIEIANSGGQYVSMINPSNTSQEIFLYTNNTDSSNYYRGIRTIA